MTPILSGTLLTERKKTIDEILSRGGVVKFTGPRGTKFVREWNPDEDGDLCAFHTENALVPYVAWESVAYKVSEALPGEYPETK